MTPLPDQAPTPLPWATRAALLRRTLTQAERPAPRLIDLEV